ncbi:MAG: hypothetical protein HQK97_12865 [Nitrospirae bacterium]|nr:hypothetical protein [Nitrospirota bacterium]
MDSLIIKDELPAYGVIQEKSFEIYSSGNSKSDLYFGLFDSVDKEYVKSIIEDKEIYYGV